VTVVGGLGKDPEVRATPNGKKVANFSVAVDQGFGDNKKTEWVNVVVFDKLAELAEKYLKKGKQVALSGTLRTTSWDDKQSGQKRYKTEVVARDLTFMDTRSGSTENRASAAPPARQQTAPPVRGAQDPFADTEISDDDIPF
jgi:single-strand DNA-binding protein